MADIATTRLSSKGQVVIPGDIRKKLNLKEGTRFIVLGEKDAVILKKIDPPSMEEFDRLLKKARKAAKEAGLNPSNIDIYIQEWSLLNFGLLLMILRPNYFVKETVRWGLENLTSGVLL